MLSSYIMIFALVCTLVKAVQFANNKDTNQKYSKLAVESMLNYQTEVFGIEVTQEQKNMVLASMFN